MPKHLTRADCLDPADISLLIIQARDKRDKALVCFLYLTGCRVSEALALRKEDIRVGENQIAFELITLKRKDRMRRTLFFDYTTPFLDCFLEWVKEVTEPWQFIFDYSMNKKSARVLAHRRLRRMKAGLFPHLFRHTRATRLAEAGMTEYELMNWFGWRTSGVSATYVKLSGIMAKKWSDRIT